MATIINLYVLAPSGAPTSALGPAVRALLEATFVQLPARACAPFRATTPDGQTLVTPQWLELAAARDARVVPDAVALEAELARAEREPLLLQFSQLNPDHPHVRRDFEHYRGLGCAVGLYAIPGGHRLRLDDEFASEPALDEVVRLWAHLQGEAAPWETLFRGSALERAFRSAWGELRLVENDWV